MNILLQIMQLFPFVLQGIVAVEAAVKSAPGATKKALVLSAIDTAAKVGENVPQATVSHVSALIDNVVQVLNQSGLFSHSSPGTPIPPPPTA